MWNSGDSGEGGGDTTCAQAEVAEDHVMRRIVGWIAFTGYIITIKQLVGRAPLLFPYTDDVEIKAVHDSQAVISGRPIYSDDIRSNQTSPRPYTSCSPYSLVTNRVSGIPSGSFN